MKKSALTILFLTMFLVMLSLGIILPHLTYYAEELGARAAQIGFLISIYSAMKLIFAPVWGRLSDQYGRRPAILIGLIGNAGALILFGAVRSLPWLFIARSLSGVFSAAILPTVMAYVAAVTTEEDRGKGMGLMGAAMGLGFIAGPGIGGIIGSHNLPFFIAGGLSLATFCFALILLPAGCTRPKPSRSPAGLPQSALSWHLSVYFIRYDGLVNERNFRWSYNEVESSATILRT